MKKCRECGSKLKVKYSRGAKEIAKKSIKYFDQLIQEKGEGCLTGNQKAKMNSMLYESRMVLNDEALFEDAFCDKCRKARSDKTAGLAQDLSGKNLMSREELEAIKDRGERDSLFRGIEAIVKKYR